MGYASNALVFLVHTLFTLYLVAVILRFLLQVTRADFYNPISQFLVKVTDPPLRPLRRVIPGVMGIDAASIVLMVAIKCLEVFLVLLLQNGSLNFAALLVLSIAGLLGLIINIYFFTILIQVVVSWINPGSYNPAIALLDSINRPILSRIRRWIPAVSGFDLSPIFAFIFLTLLLMLVVAPISDFGQSLARGGMF